MIDFGFIFLMLCMWIIEGSIVLITRGMLFIVRSGRKQEGNDTVHIVVLFETDDGSYREIYDVHVVI